MGTSLAVQRIRLWTPSAGGPGSISGQGTKILPTQLSLPNAMETQHSQINLKNKNEWGSRGKEHIYTYGLFMSIYGRNQHSIVKQFPHN